mgnify:CR=1 FL=1
MVGSSATIDTTLEAASIYPHKTRLSSLGAPLNARCSDAYPATLQRDVSRI